MGLISMNLDYIHAINACRYDEFKKFIETLLDSDCKITKLFTSKKYIWNWHRGKDFYKLMTMFIVELVRNQSYKEAAAITEAIVFSIPNKKEEAVKNIRKFFISAIMKNAPFLTLKILPFITPGRLEIILDSDLNKIYVEEPLVPIINKIIQLKQDFDIAYVLSDI